MKTGAPAITVALATAAAVTFAEERPKVSEDEAARRWFTDTEVVDQTGTVRRFYTDLVRGRRVLINFGFSSCKGVCPAAGANLARVQRLLGQRAVTMITVTVDPVNDTPAVLRRYAEQIKAGPGWYFLTGAPENVNRVLGRLGGLARKPEEHSAVLLVGNAATGSWAKASALDKPESIITLLDHLDDKR